MKILKHLIAGAFMLGISSMASAAIPPPPVNQNLGIPDTAFSHFSQELCQACHWASAKGLDPLSGAPVKPGLNPNRHHLLVGEPADGNPDFPPFRDPDGDGINNATLNCYSCHIINNANVDINTAVLEGIIELNYRNCLNCHGIPSNQVGRTTVHHKTELAQTGFCFRCHGGLVRGINVDTLEGKKPDPNDVAGTVPVVIPEYRPSIITPWRSNKPNRDFSITSSAGTNPGNCNFCHNTAEGSGGPGAGLISGDQGGTIEVVNLPDGSTFNAPILTNAQNHHNTGFFGENKCAWCHEIDGDFQTGSLAIRVCQRCHDRSTLHNIEFDAVGDGIAPGREEPYYGHIGNEANCWGCHGNNKQVQNEDGEWVDPRTNLGVTNQGVVVSNDENARISVSSALIPTINTLSTQTVGTGEEVQITISGTNLVNSSLTRTLKRDENGQLMRDENNEFITIDTPVVWKSEVVVRDKNNNVIVIEPDYQDTNKLEFTLPGTLAKGVYQVSLKKAGQVSNPIGLTVVPSITVQQAFVYTPFGNLAIISGSNFMETVQGMTYKMVDQNDQAPLIVYVWRDDLIIALFGDTPDSVTIEHIFDKKTIPLTRY